MKMPTFKKPTNKMTDSQLVVSHGRIMSYFNDYSRGDKFGWDWPTMNAVFPELCAKAREINQESEKRLIATGGKFNGKTFAKDAKGNWREVSEPTYVVIEYDDDGAPLGNYGPGTLKQAAAKVVKLAAAHGYNVDEAEKRNLALGHQTNLDSDDGWTWEIITVKPF